MTTPPQGPHIPGQPPQYPTQPGPYGQPGQFPPGQPGQPGQLPPGQPGQLPPGQPGSFGVQPNNPTQQGYAPYSPSGGFGYGYAPPGQLASWPIRVGASLLDSVLPMVPIGVGLIAGVAFSSGTTSGGRSSAGGAVIGLSYLLAVLIAFWNRVIKQGRTGQSFGKKVTGLKIVSESTGETIGIGRTFGREVCSILFSYLCFLNALWPLWDQKQQTWHDKVVSDLVIQL